MRLCAADVKARLERDKKGSSLEAIVAAAEQADCRRLHRICRNKK